MNLTNLFLVQDMRLDKAKQFRPSKDMIGNAAALMISILVAMFVVPEAQAAAGIMGLMAFANMILRWISSGGDVKAKMDGL